jgi:hypothetical protein
MRIVETAETPVLSVLAVLLRAIFEKPVRLHWASAGKQEQ